MDWITDTDWMANIRLIINMLCPSKVKKREHCSGIIEETSECNILEHPKKDSLIIAPFRDRKYKHTVLLWNPRTIRVLAKFSAIKVWALWDDYYAVLLGGLPSIKSIMIYIRTSKGMKKLKNLTLTSNFSPSLLQHVVGSKRFKAIYVMEDYRLCMVSIISKVQQEWTSKEKIVQTMICDELGLLVICSEHKVMIHSLDQTGKVKDLVCWIPVEFELAVACLESRILSIVTYDKRIGEIACSESDEDDDMNVYLSKYRLESEGYDVIQDGNILAELPQCDYRFEFVTGNKVIACYSEQKPLVLLSVNTGEVLFKHTMIGKVLKVHPKEGAIFISSESAVQKLNVDAYIPS